MRYIRGSPDLEVGEFGSGARMAFLRNKLTRSRAPLQSIVPEVKLRRRLLRHGMALSESISGAEILDAAA
jgi:hypothetical protein